MATSSDERSRLIRVQGPALPPVTLVSESNPTADVCKLVRVSGPALPPVMLRSEPVAPVATVRLTLPLPTADDGAQVFDKLHLLIGKLNEMEDLGGRAGVWVDGERSGVRNGEVVLVLAPNDPADALATCKRIAHILFNASPGVTVKVFAAASDAPVYELAA